MRQKSIDTYISETIDSMKSLGTFKSEYMEVVKIYAALLFQHDIQFKLYKKSKYATQIEFINGNGKTTSKPNPLIKILESLRKDIKTYSDTLCLNPKINKNTATNTKKQSTKMSRAPQRPLRVVE